VSEECRSASVEALARLVDWRSREVAAPEPLARPACARRERREEAAGRTRAGARRDGHRVITTPSIGEFSVVQQQIERLPDRHLSRQCRGVLGGHGARVEHQLDRGLLGEFK
jgi:hypothetical protein